MTGRTAAALAVLIVAAIALPAQASAAGLVTFQSPSKNIGCALDKAFARCDARKHDWKPPPKPQSCALDWGQGVSIDVTGRGEFVCAGDTTLGSGKRLAYGSSITRGRFRCASRRRGVKCVNTKNNHGFEISRQRVRRF